jgi:hypothetical protein
LREWKIKKEREEKERSMRERIKFKHSIIKNYVLHLSRTMQLGVYNTVVSWTSAHVTGPCSYRVK